MEHGIVKSRGVPQAGAIIPWLQDFTLGEPAYGAAEVRAQIQAAYDAGIQEWVLWNAGSRYTETALEPVNGFPREPVIRVGDRVVPVSQRFEALASPDPVGPEASPPPATSRCPSACARRAGHTRR